MANTACSLAQQPAYRMDQNHWNRHLSRLAGLAAAGVGLYGLLCLYAKSKGPKETLLTKEELRQLYLSKYERGRLESPSAALGSDSASGTSPPEPPVTAPLDTVEELLGAQVACPPACAASVHYDPRMEDRSRPQLLVCHDMANNYKEDRFVQGADAHQLFRLWHWHCVDVFVYFSHHLVTLPTTGWINAAHVHGVKVLGTLITEGEGGRSACEAMFASHAAAQLAAERLAELAVSHGFEGWLLNIENPLTRRQARVALHFTAYLRALVEARVPGGTVIWYDAVTVEGKLRWQNSVNDLNEPFFDAAHGIFVNYGWRSHTPAQLAERVGARSPDVFLGVDVFGRGTFGGGGMNTCAALAAAAGAGLSAAIFAPGWVYEAHGGGEGFAARQHEYWRRVAAVWPSRVGSHEGLPLATNFCGGEGRGLYVEGRCVRSSPWFNLSAQQPQPNLVPSASASPAGQAAAARAASSPAAPHATLIDTIVFDGSCSLLLEAAAAPVVAGPGSSPGVGLGPGVGTGSRAGQAPVLLFPVLFSMPCAGLDAEVVVRLGPGARVRLALWCVEEAPWPRSGHGIGTGSSTGLALTPASVLCFDGECVGAAGPVAPGQEGVVDDTGEIHQGTEMEKGDGAGGRAGRAGKSHTSPSEGIYGGGGPVFWHRIRTRVQARAVPEGCRVVGVGLQLVPNGDQGAGMLPAGAVTQLAHPATWACVGQVRIAEAGLLDSPVPQPVELSVRQTHMAQPGPGDAPGGPRLHCVLTWRQPGRRSDVWFYHVWVVGHVGQGDTGPEQEKAIWIGHAFGTRFVADGVEVPAGCSEVRLAVQPVGHNGMAPALESCAVVDVQML